MSKNIVNTFRAVGVCVRAPAAANETADGSLGVATGTGDGVGGGVEVGVVVGVLTTVAVATGYGAGYDAEAAVCPPSRYATTNNATSITIDNSDNFLISSKPSRTIQNLWSHFQYHRHTPSRYHR